MFTLLMWRNREAIKSRTTPGGGPEINHLEFIYSSYDPKYYFFGSIDMVRRLSLTSLLVLLWDQDMQIFTALFITIATVVCYREMAPYWYSSVDVLSYMCNWQLVLCILGLLFMDVKGEMKTNETFISIVLMGMSALISGMVVYHQCIRPRDDDKDERVTNMRTTESRRVSDAGLADRSAATKQSDLNDEGANGSDGGLGGSGSTPPRHINIFPPTLHIKIQPLALITVVLNSTSHRHTDRPINHPTTARRVVGASGSNGDHPRGLVRECYFRFQHRCALRS